MKSTTIMLLVALSAAPAIAGECQTSTTVDLTNRVIASGWSGQSGSGPVFKVEFVITRGTRSRDDCRMFETATEGLGEIRISREDAIITRMPTPKWSDISYDHPDCIDPIAFGHFTSTSDVQFAIQASRVIAIGNMNSSEDVNRIYTLSSTGAVTFAAKTNGILVDSVTKARAFPVLPYTRDENPSKFSTGHIDVREAACSLAYFLSSKKYDPTSDVFAAAPNVYSVTSKNMSDYGFTPEIKMDLVKLGLDERSLIRNEIYARHGYEFKAPLWRDIFGQVEWYEPKDTFQESELTSGERSLISSLLK